MSPENLLNMLDWSWRIIANAGWGNWENEAPEWKQSAEKWRDEYHEILREYPTLDVSKVLPDVQREA